MAATMAHEAQSSEARFAKYVDALTAVLGREDRARPLKDYCTGLLMPGERKSVEPMAAVVAPAQVSAKHQSLLHLVGQAAWSDEALLGKVRELVLPAIEAQGRIEAWIVDDTGFAKKGVHSVGVARQYCGRLGKTDNCQIAVTLSVANHPVSLPIAYRLYLPEDWAADETRRKKAHVPDNVTFKTKPQIALDQIRATLAVGVAPGVLLADAGYGVDGAFRSGVMALGLPYVGGGQPFAGERLAPRHGAAAAQTLEWTGPPAIARPARWRTCAGFRHEAGDGASPGGLAHRAVAGWLQRNLVLALCRRADTAGFAGLATLDAPSARMASHRMAGGRKGADEILAFDLAGRHAYRCSRRHRQIALAHRATMRNSKVNSASP